MSRSGGRPWVVGLTGGIGSGKTAAANRFADLGAGVVDTDLIAHGLTAPGGKAVALLRDAFGAGVITAEGALDRQVMRTLVFAEPLAKQRLEDILHPMIRAESEDQLSQLDAPYALLVVPLLVESGHYAQRCQRVCVVDCPEALQVARVVLRSGMPEAQVRAIMATQVSRAARLAAADDVIDNSGDLTRLVQQVDALHQTYLALAARQRP